MLSRIQGSNQGPIRGTRGSGPSKPAGIGSLRHGRARGPIAQSSSAGSWAWRTPSRSVCPDRLTTSVPGRSTWTPRGKTRCWVSNDFRKPTSAVSPSTPAASRCRRLWTSPQVRWSRTISPRSLRTSPSSGARSTARELRICGRRTRKKRCGRSCTGSSLRSTTGCTDAVSRGPKKPMRRRTRGSGPPSTGSGPPSTGWS